MDKLKEKPLGLFICGMQEDEAIETEIKQNFSSELIKVAAAKEHFLGGGT
ncbi:MAG: hypothetical protein GX800_05195 [Clostridiaceae bacterium]|nr:hypothetical protein [Clostridiaceae bacterium]